MSDLPVEIAETWRTAHGDLTDEQWELIAEIFDPPRGPAKMGRPKKVDRRRVVDAVLFICATGAQWRALPTTYPNWNTVHRLHLKWSRDGTWQRAAEVVRELVRVDDDREPEPSAGAIDARSVRGAATVGRATRGYDAGKKISGRKQFGIVDTNGLLLAVGVWPAAVSDNFGGIHLIDTMRAMIGRFQHLWCDAGFKKTFIDHCRRHHISVEVVPRVAEPGFHVLPRRWVAERTWSWLMNNRRLQVDYERDPIVTEGFIWAAHLHLLLRRHTQPQPAKRAG